MWQVEGLGVDYCGPTAEGLGADGTQQRTDRSRGQGQDGKGMLGDGYGDKVGRYASMLLALGWSCSLWETVMNSVECGWVCG